jgi:hypothetical protein
MGMAGNEQNQVRWNICKCGKPGFVKESDATRFMVNRRRLSEPVDSVRCPVGDCIHTFNPGIKEKQEYLKYLTDTAGHAARRKVRDTAALAVQGSTEASTSHVASRVACNKLGYGSETLANGALRQAREAGRNEKRVYECPTCGRWHLSSLEEFFPVESIAYEELLGYVQQGELVSVYVGRYPSGTIANVTFSSARGVALRIHAEHLNPVRLVLDSLEEAIDPSPASSDANRGAAGVTS